MKYNNIHERISERYLLSGDIKNEIIQLYKSELIKFDYKILMEVSQFNVMEFNKYPEVSRTFWWFDI